MRTQFYIQVRMVAFLTFAFLATCISSSDAQRRCFAGLHYTGFTATFGERYFPSESNYPQINRSIVRAEGGQVGMIAGNRLIRGEVGLLGYYSSVSDVAGTIELHTNHAAIRFYPVGLFTKRSFRVDPYVAAGVAYDRYKFYGHYAQGNNGICNYSAPEPFIGRIDQTNTTIGIGLQFKIVDEYDFVHVFTELKGGKPISQSNLGPELGNTHLGRNTTFNIGIAFGYNR